MNGGQDKSNSHSSSGSRSERPLRKFSGEWAWALIRPGIASKPFPSITFVSRPGSGSRDSRLTFLILLPWMEMDWFAVIPSRFGSRMATLLTRMSITSSPDSACGRPLARLSRGDRLFKDLERLLDLPLRDHKRRG